ncbi:TPA: glycosyltransferase [Clostridium perfringens]|nr:glycosyltransferase [Clostridium perfringens]HAT4284983.1 glycosyltransferase [Clostridium perfringens]
MKKDIKILHLLSSSSFSGAENVAVTIINGMKNKYNLAYASLDGDIRINIKDKKIKFIGLKNISLGEVKRVIDSFKPDIIHAHDFTMACMCSVLCWRVPIVAHIHQSPQWLKKISFKSFLFLISSINFKKIIFVNSETKIQKYIEKIIRNKIVILTNVLDKEKILNLSKIDINETYDIVFLGRLVDVKDPLRLINIVSKIKKIKSNIKVAIIGDGVLKSECENIVEVKGMNKNIILKGFMENPFPIINNSKLFIMTSKSEGTPMAMIEALILGKPVIVPELPTMEIVNQFSIGYICKSDEEYINNIIRVLNDKEIYDKIVNNINKYVQENIICEEYFQKIDDIYKELKYSFKI